MGVSDKKLYDWFTELNRRVIKPAIKEINAVSDIQIIQETFKEGRSSSLRSNIWKGETSLWDFGGIIGQPVRMTFH